MGDSGAHLQSVGIRPGASNGSCLRSVALSPPARCVRPASKPPKYAPRAPAFLPIWESRAATVRLIEGRPTLVRRSKDGVARELERVARTELARWGARALPTGAVRFSGTFDPEERVHGGIARGYRGGLAEAGTGGVTPLVAARALTVSTRVDHERL